MFNVHNQTMSQNQIHLASAKKLKQLSDKFAFALLFKSQLLADLPGHTEVGF